MHNVLILIILIMVMWYLFFLRWIFKHFLPGIFMYDDLFSVVTLFIFLNKSQEFLMYELFIVPKRGGNILAKDVVGIIFLSPCVCVCVCVCVCACTHSGDKNCLIFNSEEENFIYIYIYIYNIYIYKRCGVRERRAHTHTHTQYIQILNVHTRNLSVKLRIHWLYPWQLVKTPRPMDVQGMTLNCIRLLDIFRTYRECRVPKFPLT